MSRSRIVTGRFAGTTSYPPPARGTATVVRWNSGMYLPTGSESSSAPCSCSIIAATLTIALVCEAMRKIVSARIGLCDSRSRSPTARRNATWPWRATSTTAPASWPWST